MSFLFVDRILASGRDARGSFHVPPEAAEWPAFLLAEAVGQLASWIGMAEVDFRARPVAALAGEVLIEGEARPGDRIDLSARIQGIEKNALLYQGAATAGDRALIRRTRCVGPFLAMEDFDDPAAVRERYDRLCDGRAAPAPFEPIAAPAFEIVEQQPGRALRARLEVPRQAALFAEHFPRRPVYPATLLLDRQIHIARRLLDGSGWRVARASHVKIGAFVFPGEMLEIQAVATSADEGRVTVALTGLRDGTRVSRARMEFVRSVA
jgi:3-hydroxymyristoyl/3-hydroxydecanoyl-(acyl carrier protein) dehydratase